jgi:CHAT domain-containing protein
MSPKILLATFITAGVLSAASNSLAFVQGDRSSSELQSPDNDSQAEALLQNALRLSDAQDGVPARQQMQEATRIWVRIHEAEKAAKALVQIGDRCRQAIKYPDALRYYRQALGLKSLPRPVTASALNAIALIYSALCARDLAAHYFEQALEQADSINDLPAQTIALTGLGDIQRQNGDLRSSLVCITRCLRLREKNHADPDPALLYLKGRVSQERGWVDDAQRAFEEALAIYRNTEDVRGQVRTLCALSTLSLLASQKQVALGQAEQARELAESEKKRAVTEGDYLNAHESLWHAYLGHARAERDLGEIKIALQSYSLAIDYFEGVWIGLYMATETSALAHKEEVQVAYRENVDLLMAQRQFMKAAGLADRALGRTLLNFTGARRSRPRSEDSEQAETMGRLSRSMVHRRLELLASNLSRAQRLKAQKDLEEAQYEIGEARLQYEMEHLKDRWVWSPLITAEQLQDKMARDQMALAEFTLGENRSFVWLFTRGDVYFEILPSRKEIEKAVKSYLNILASAPNPLYVDRDLAKLSEQSEGLFATLFGRLSEQIKPGEPLIIVPDGLLHYLPFEALIHNKRYLVEDHEISYSPSASVLVQSQESSGHAEAGDRMELLAFGDPIFGPELNASVTRMPGRRHIDVTRDARASRGFQLPPLPRTRDEVQYIASLFPADRTKLYLGKDSTEDAVKRESLRRYRRLHFATHSLVDEVSPSRSAVVLTLNNNPEEDGFLEVNEISDLDLDCDLVVLSACQTGRGQLLSGEGIVGLSRAFLYAGARSVVVSLWSVSDISTGRLMKTFYQHLAGNLSNSAALRLAKLQMLQSGTETRHPYYWAPFIAVGKP